MCVKYENNKVEHFTLEAALSFLQEWPISESVLLFISCDMTLYYQRFHGTYRTVTLHLFHFAMCLCLGRFAIISFHHVFGTVSP